jgi:hypothetical protein
MAIASNRLHPKRRLCVPVVPLPFPSWQHAADSRYSMIALLRAKFYRLDSGTGANNEIFHCATV